MSIKFRVVQRPVALGQNKGKTMQVAQALTGKRISFKRLCDEIADGSTVDTADVKAVVDRMVRVLRRHMEDGDSVECGDLGTFSPSISSHLVEHTEVFNATTHIRGAKINFRAKPEFKALRSVHFERISKEEEAARVSLAAKKKGKVATAPKSSANTAEHTAESDHLGV